MIKASEAFSVVCSRYKLPLKGHFLYKMVSASRFRQDSRKKTVGTGNRRLVEIGLRNETTLGVGAQGGYSIGYLIASV